MTTDNRTNEPTPEQALVDEWIRQADRAKSMTGMDAIWFPDAEETLAVLRANGLLSEGTPSEAQIQIFDQIDMPEYNPSANSGRGDWGLRNVSDGTVMTHPTDLVRCVEHGAMNSVSPNRAIWRCLMCGRSAYRDIAGDAALVAAQGAAPQAVKDVHEPSHDRVYCVRCGGNWPCQPAPVLPSSGVDEDALAEVIEDEIRLSWDRLDNYTSRAWAIARAVAEWLKGQK